MSLLSPFLANFSPPLVLALNTISESPLVLSVSTQTTYTVPFSVAAICGEEDNNNDDDDAIEPSISLLSVLVLPNFSPPLVLALNTISESPLVLFVSTQTTYTVPFSVAAICGEEDNNNDDDDAVEPSISLLSVLVLPNFSPPLVLPLNTISESPLVLFVSTQTTYTVPFSVAAICGEEDNN